MTTRNTDIQPISHPDPSDGLRREHAAGELDERFAERLSKLGTESTTERSVKRIVPWIVSLALHLALLAVGFVVTWTILQFKPEDPVRIVADFNATAYDPVVMQEVVINPEQQEMIFDRVKVEVSDERLAEQLAELDMDLMGFLAESSHDASASRFAPQFNDGSASFVGLTATNAKRIVYVIDASGSMIASLQFVLDELARSLDGLTKEQSFALIFFQRNQALMVPPTDQLTPATQKDKLRLLQWAHDNVIPSGRSNPLEAIKKALSFQPDAIFMLSENITGSGQFEIDRDDLLAMLDTLNPIDPATGRRKTQIHCIQFLRPDPLDTLRLIAERHGGPKAYKFLDEEELGLTAP